MQRVCDFCGEVLGAGHAFRTPDRLLEGEKSADPVPGYTDVCDTCITTHQVEIVAALVEKGGPEAPVSE